MKDRIFTLKDKTIEAAEEEPFASEDELQALIANHLELLDGEQIHPGEPRRWLLVSREKGISQRRGEGAWWAVDHLILDQDATPTFVEVKRGANPEVRRTVVGQLLEYAAHASETWTKEELREKFEGQYNDGDEARGMLTEFLQPDDHFEVDEFWDEVARNLAARRLRLLFVADEIPDSLANVVSFLNSQMPQIEVLAVEIKQYPIESGKTLVPRVIGRATQIKKSSPREPIDRETFFNQFNDAEARDAAKRLLEVTDQVGGEIHYGNSYGLSIRVKCSQWSSLITVAWLFSRHDTGWMKTRDFSFGAAVLDYPDLPDELRRVLQDWTESFSQLGFVTDVSSKGVKAWAVSHEDAKQHLDQLEERLRFVLNELSML